MLSAEIVADLKAKGWTKTGDKWCAPPTSSGWAGFMKICLTETQIEYSEAIKAAKEAVTVTQIESIASTLDYNIQEGRHAIAQDLGIVGLQLELERLSAGSAQEISETLDSGYADAMALLRKLLKTNNASDVIPDKEKEKTAWESLQEWLNTYWYIIIIGLVLLTIAIYLLTRYWPGGKK